MTIRKAHQDEWEKLQVLNDEVFIDNLSYDPDLVVDWAFSDVGSDYFKELVRDKESLCIVAETNTGKLVGYLAASPKPISYRKSRYLEIDNMGVSKEFRSQGLGTKLINFCKEWAKNNGYEKLFVNSYFENKKAISFYKQVGFGEIDVSLELLID